MTKLLEQAIEKTNSLPPEMQDDIARIMLQYAGDEPAVYTLTPEERADLAEADAEIERGEFATDEQARAMWAKHGL